MNKLLLVGLGGFIGSILRYAIYMFTVRYEVSKGFPFGTFTVNIIGCFLIGIVAGFAATHDNITPEIKAFLMVGILGGFTTFSAFGNETYVLIQAGTFSKVLLNLFGQVTVGMLAVWAGYALSKNL